MQGHIVCLCIDLVHGGQHFHGGIQVQGVVQGQIGVIAHNAHTQCVGGVGHQHADGAQTNQTQGLAHDVGAHESGRAFFHHGGDVSAGSGLFLHPGDTLRDLAGGQQQSGDGQLLHAVGVGAGGVEDNDTGLGGAVQGDVVDAGAGAGNALQGGGELILMELGGTNQNRVLVGCVVGDLETIVQLGQADLRDLIHGFNLIHGKTFLSEIEIDARQASPNAMTPERIFMESD